MAIRTNLAPRYFWNQAIWAVACLVLGLWGCYDLWVKIPAQEQRVENFRKYEAAHKELEEIAAVRPLNADEAKAYEEIDAELSKITEAPTPPGTWDRLTQWMFISLLLCVPYFAWDLMKAKSKSYKLEDDGTVVLNEKQRWTPEEIADIDMSKWMSKSIATLIHRNGETAKLDAYLYKDLDKIVGAIAHRLYPEQWNEDATPVKAPAETDAADEDLPENDAGSGGTEGEEPRPSPGEVG